MIIGIDISQMAFGNKGIPRYLANLVKAMITNDRVNKYLLFFSSLRQTLDQSFLEDINFPNVEVKIFHIPPILLDFIWNRIHIYTIENLIGDVDIFITSDWLEPPTRKAKKATIIYDLVVYKNPEVSTKQIVETQKRKLEWVKRESDVVFCISQATKQDVRKILGIEEKKLKVIYPGM